MNTQTLVADDVLRQAEAGIQQYLKTALEGGKISRGQFEMAERETVPNLRQWLGSARIDEISPNLKLGVADAVAAGRWEELVNAYRQSMRFGTGGIRGMMGFDRASIVRLKEEGLDARILKGPNTLNNIVVTRVSAGVAQYGKDGGRTFDRIVIGYDSRVRGGDFARLIAELFLAYGYTVYLFDEPCPYPEVTFAIPFKEIKAQIGLLISASHNDYRYNGYKLSSGNGSQFDPRQRDEMYESYITKATFDDIKLLPLDQAPEGKLWWLGGSEPVPGVNYHGREGNLINIHGAHVEHCKSFLIRKDFSGMKDPLRMGFCPYHGAGRKAVPRLLGEVGLTDIRITNRNSLSELDGLFPSFNSEPGREQQPDPGDPRAARIAVEAFKAEYPGQFEKTDMLIGTDPDADRLGIVVRVPEEQRAIHGGEDWTLLPADEMWAVLLWYRLSQEAAANGGRLPDAHKRFIVLSHTTSDSSARVARKFGLGVVKTWVGFAALSAAVRDAWDNVPRANLVEGREPGAELSHPFILEYQDMTDERSFNEAAMEQSNGFSMLGGRPLDAFSMGEGGHVRDKDGTFAALLCAEVAAWAKQQGHTLQELIDRHVYLDPEVGLFANLYEPDPLDGEYPGIEGDRKKMGILQKALDLMRQVEAGQRVEIGGEAVRQVVMYRTGKYDRIYPPGDGFVFADEGIRFYFDEEKLSHLTVRPSGTGNSLRFHVQMFGGVVPEAELVARKGELKARGQRVIDDIRERLGALR